MRQMRVIAIVRAGWIFFRDASSCLVMLHGVAKAPTKSTFEQWIGDETAYHFPVPGLATAIRASGHLFLIKPIGDGTAIRIRLQSAEYFLVNRSSRRILVDVVIALSPGR